MPNFEYINAKILKIDGEAVATKKFVEAMITKYIPIGGFPCLINNTTHNGIKSQMVYNKLPPGIKISNGIDGSFLKDKLGICTDISGSFNSCGIPQSKSCINFILSKLEPCPSVHPIWFRRIEGYKHKDKVKCLSPLYKKCKK